MHKLLLHSLISAATFSALVHAEERTDEPIDSHEQIDAALWVQSSAEFYACTSQTYAVAGEKLQLALRDPMWTASPEQFEAGDYGDQPPAVIVNLDETVWSNSGYQSRIILEYGQHDMSQFVRWCNEAKCVLIPGALGFLKQAKKSGVSIVYITPRPEVTREGTLRNLRQLGLPYEPSQDDLLMGGVWPSHDKREHVGSDHRILLILSDHLGDFMRNTDKGGTESRREMAARNKDYWGLKWFIIPNPLYGHWEYSLHKYNYGLDRKSRVQNKLDAIKRNAAN